jgi:hypothetical protein
VTGPGDPGGGGEADGAADDTASDADADAEVAEDESTDAVSPRQHVARARGARRARLTPAPGSDPAPESAVPGAHDDREQGAARPTRPEDERITRERPPHW